MEGMKHYGWGVVDASNKSATSMVIKDKEHADRYAYTFNTHSTGDGIPYKAVELFYKEDQS